MPILSDLGRLAFLKASLNDAMRAASSVAPPGRARSMRTVILSDEFYGFANECALFLRRHRSSDAEAAKASAHDLAVDVMLSMADNPEAFRGEAAYTTYVENAIKRQMSQRGRQDSPAWIRRIDPSASRMYAMIQEGCRDDEILAVFQASMPADRAADILRQVHEVASLKRIKRNQRLKDPLQYTENPGDPGFEANAVTAHYPTPDIAFEEAHIKEAYDFCLASRTEGVRQLIERCLIQGDKGAQAEIGAALGIRNPAYQIRRFRADLFEALRQRGLDHLVRFLG